MSNGFVFKLKHRVLPVEKFAKLSLVSLGRGTSLPAKARKLFTKYLGLGGSGLGQLNGAPVAIPSSSLHLVPQTKRAPHKQLDLRDLRPGTLGRTYLSAKNRSPRSASPTPSKLRATSRPMARDRPAVWFGPDRAARDAGPAPRPERGTEPDPRPERRLCSPGSARRRGLRAHPHMPAWEPN